MCFEGISRLSDVSRSWMAVLSQCPARATIHCESGILNVVCFSSYSAGITIALDALKSVATKSSAAAMTRLAKYVFRSLITWVLKLMLVNCRFGTLTLANACILYRGINIRSMPLHLTAIELQVVLWTRQSVFGQQRRGECEIDIDDTFKM